MNSHARIIMDAIMRYTTLFFDVDDTLYPNRTGLWSAIRARMGLYMTERLGMTPEQAAALRHKYFTTYGTTLRGLQKFHHVDADEYLAYVHDLPLDQYLDPAPELRQILLSLPQRRWVFTNADDRHARRVLARLGISDCFEGMVDLRAMAFACKPEAKAFERALALAGLQDCQGCILFDDAPANLQGAKAFGFTTVLVGSDGAGRGDLPAAENDHHADCSIHSLLELPQAMPDLWSGA
jgi:putative hydrolase of the HAD superfamily